MTSDVKAPGEDGGRARWYGVGGVAVLLAGCLVSAYLNPYDGGDFLSFHLMGQALVRGVNIYEAGPRAALSALVGQEPPEGMYYPPATGFLVIPFALLPFEIGRHLWYLALNLCVLFGVRALVRHLAPRAPSYVWMTLVGVILMSATLRWGLMLSQGAPIILGLLCYFVVALDKRASGQTLVIASLATAFKMTLSLPFLGLLALTRRYVAAAVSVAAWAALNFLGFWRMGGRSTVALYTANMSSLDAIDNPLNINMPDPWREVALPRLDWLFLFYGLTRNFGVSRLLSLACAGLLSLWLLREGLRAKDPHGLPTLTAFLGPLICLGSLCVYHHQYDLCIFLVPVLLALFRYRVLVPPPPAIWLVSPLLLMILFLPIGTAQNLLSATFGGVGVALLKLSFPIATTLALFGTLLLLRRNVSADVAPAPGPITNKAAQS